MFTPSDRAQLNRVALHYLSGEMGLECSDAIFSIEFETLTIEALKPEIIDFFNENQSELIERAYLTTGIQSIDIRFMGELVLSFTVRCEAIDTKPSAMSTATLEKPAQIDLPISDVPMQRTEQLIDIEQVISQLASRMNQQPAKIRSSIDAFVPIRYKLGDREYITQKALTPIVQRWAETIANDVAMAIQGNEMIKPVPSVPKKTTPAKKTGTAKKPAQKKAAPKVETAPE